MTVPVLPPAGWYPDPEDSDGERYWSGAVWSDDKRARPGVAEPALPHASGVQPTSSADGAEGVATAATPRKKHWGLGRTPLAEVVDDLHSDDPARRTAAAAQLYSARRRGDAAGRFEAEIACLDDPLPEVRFRALRVMAVLKEDRKRLVSLLLSGQPADAARKASVLARIAEMLGPDSPHDGLARKGLQAQFLGNTGRKGIFDVVLREDHSPAITLPVLEAARTLGLAPRLFAPWELDPETGAPAALQTFDWPDRCSGCGRLDPRDSKPVPFSVSWNWASNLRYGTTTITGTVSVPTCTTCHTLPSLRADSSGVTMWFSSPAFVADLLDQGFWTRVGGDWVGR